MKSYRVEIIPRSPWGTPLHADTLFGHLCWALAYTQGESALCDFLQAFAGSQPPLVLSSGFSKGCLPRPLFPAIAGPQEEQDTKDRKKLKHMSLLDEQWLLSARDGLNEEKIQHALENVGKKDPQHEELGYHNTIDRRSNAVRDEGGFFQSVDYHFSTDTRLNVYVKTDYFSDNTLRELFDVIAKSGFGRDTSAGLGAFSFTLDAFDFPRLPEANAFIALSNFVPAPHDPTSGWYDLTTKFGKLGGDFAVGPTGSGHGHNPFKKPLIMLRSGSVFRDPQVREWYGRLVPDVHTNPEIRHYGLCYPLEVRL
jgi:CRISPR-associated protein Csm4